MPLIDRVNPFTTIDSEDILELEQEEELSPERLSFYIGKRDFDLFYAPDGGTLNIEVERLGDGSVSLYVGERRVGEMGPLRDRPRVMVKTKKLKISVPFKREYVRFIRE